MKVWLFEISDFLPGIDGDNRLYRAGMLAKALHEAGHEILWWSSTFNHQLRKQRFDVSTVVDISEKFRLRLLFGPGYKRSISMGRFHHNRTVAKAFSDEIAANPENELPDLIYTCLPTLEVSEQSVLFASRHHIPVVVDIRDRWPDIYLSPFPRVLHPMVRIILKTEFARARRILSKATAITGVSEKNLKWGLDLSGREAGSKDKWFPLGFPVLKNRNNDAITRIKSPRRLGIKEDCFVITFVGSFSPTCNFRTVTQTARGLSERGDMRMQFVLVGDGGRSTFLRKHSKGLGNVVLTGWCEKPQVDKILSCASVGLMPYDRNAPQTLPNKTFEYMAAGLPILSSLEGELKTIIEREGIGMQYEASDPNDLKAKIIWLFSHPEEREAMGKKAKALFEKKYSADVVYPRLVEHLCRIVDERDPQSGR